MRKRGSFPIYVPIVRQKDTPSFEKEMEKLTVCWARALAAALNSDSIRMSLPRNIHYRKIIKMKLTTKKVWPSPDHSPGTCLHKSSHRFHSEAHTGDSSLDFLVFWYSSSRWGRQQIPVYLHCAHWLPFWWFVDEFPSLAFLKRWFMIFPLFCQAIQWIVTIITARHFMAESKSVFQYWWKTLHSTQFRRASHLGEKHLIAVNFLIELSCMSCFKLEESQEKIP